MPSSPEFPSAFAGEARAVFLQRWNRRLHSYLGLYFLFFLWLFALTGLLLNHSDWSFAEFWPMRKVSTWEQSVLAPPAGSPLEEAKHLLAQLSLTGEIEWLAVAADPNRLVFRVARPGLNHEIKFDRERARASIQRTEVNAWGVLRVLHTFTGVRANDSRNQRDWIVTTLWVFAMDALAAGLIVLVAGGLWLWWSDPRKRGGGLLAFGLGFLVCGAFVWGLRWFGAG